MKYKLKSRLFAALALSGASFCWPASATYGQADDYGFIRAIEPTRDIDQASASQTKAPQPPIVTGRIPSKSKQTTALMPQVDNRNSKRAATAPMPFASSNVFGGSYIAGQATAGATEKAAYTAEKTSERGARQVGFSSNSPMPQNQGGIRAERDLPPIIHSSGDQGAKGLVPIVGPIEQNELPPIALPVQHTQSSELPPIVGAAQDLNLLEPNLAYETEIAEPQRMPPVRHAGDGASMVESSYLMHAAGDISPADGKVQATGFGEAPLAMQDAPPIIDGTVEAFPQASPSDLPGQIPAGRSFPRNGLLAPIDPVVSEPVQLPSVAPDQMGSMMSPSIVGNGIPIQPTLDQSQVFNSVVGDAPVMADSSVCGCQNCGTGGCYNPSEIAGTFNSCGCNSMARRYVVAEALYFDRDDGFINNSNFGTLNNFDPEAGWRLTFGRRTDSTRGREISYMGTLAIEQSRRTLQAGGLIQSRFVPFDGFNGDNMRAFFNATEQSEAKETFFHSLELNRVKWGWDVMKSFVGLRYFFVDDSYSMYSQSRAVAPTLGNPAGIPAEQGFFQMDAVNHLIGPHIGAELYYDVGYRWSLSGFSKAGVYANLNQFDTRLVANGVNFVDAEDNNATISTSYEAGLMAKYRLTRQAQFRVGYNVLWLGEMGTISDNLRNVTFPSGANGIPLTPSIGSGTSDSDDMFFHGFSFGFELYR